MALTVLLGGARSGKSALAVRRARGLAGPVIFVATAQARDDEMRERIARHRADRPPGWETVEASVGLEQALAATSGEACVIVDCLSLWVANLMERGDGEERILRAARGAARHAAARPGLTITVSNEVGMGVVPVHELGRVYRDVLGRVNAIWVAHAADAALVVAGRLLPLVVDDAR